MYMLAVFAAMQQEVQLQLCRLSHDGDSFRQHGIVYVLHSEGDGQ